VKDKQPFHLPVFTALLLLVCGCDYREQYIELDIREASKRRDTNFFATFAAKLNDPVPRRQPGQTSYAILIAGEEGAVDFIPFLLQTGADPTVRDSRGRGILHRIDDVDQLPDSLLSTLLQKGVDINLRDGSGDTPLHWAAMLGSSAAIPSFIQNGAKVDIQDHYGNTPLHSVYNVECAKILVAHGASLVATNGAGQTPAKAAADNRQPEIYQFLLSKEAPTQPVK
jgi:uncharacterized protein